MIVSQNINPKRNIYYLGAVILEIFNKKEEVELDFFDLYEQLILKEKNISIPLFILALDWLYILGVVEASGKNLVKKIKREAK